MIEGSVDSELQPVVRVEVANDPGMTVEVHAVVDTGCNATLTLPQTVLRQLNLPPSSRGAAQLTDGTEVEFDVHAGILIWNGVPRAMHIEAADTEPLLGTRILENQDLYIRVRAGGVVRITNI